MVMWHPQDTDIVSSAFYTSAHLGMMPEFSEKEREAQGNWVAQEGTAIKSQKWLNRDLFLEKPPPNDD